jgi:hypothetical protein
MGVNKYTYVGPILRVPIEKGPVTRNFRVDDDGRETENIFNPATGKEYGTITKTETITQRPDAYIDSDDEGAEGLEEDAFTQPEYCEENGCAIFLSNYGHDSDDTVIKSMGDLNIPEELDRFRIKWKKHLDYFEKLYGPITLDYAVVSYWS